MIYALAEDSKEGADKVEAALSAAKESEFVCVPIRFANMADTTNVYIEPHRWDLWCVLLRAVHPGEMFGGSG